MNATQVQAIAAEIGTALNTAGTIAGAVDPELLPFVVLGKAVAAAVPSLIDDVTELIDQGNPTDADNLALAQKIASLTNPAAL